MRKPNKHYHYEVDGHTVEIVRVHTGTAYARNGNVHNPTEYYRWETRLDGKLLSVRSDTRREAFELAWFRLGKGHLYWQHVDALLKAHAVKEPKGA